MNYVIYCDGGALGNHTGSASATAYGSFIIVPADPVIQYKCQFGNSKSNNEAEYAAVLTALEKLEEIIKEKGEKPLDAKVIIRTDSQLVIGQVTKNWKVNSAKLLWYVIQIQAMILTFRSIEFEHISGLEMKKILGH